MAATATACQAVWLQRLLRDLIEQEAQAITILMNNQSAIQLTRNPVFHDRTKHIDTRFHYIRECVENGKVVVEHIGTTDQLADILTKSLGRSRFQELRARIGVVNLTGF
jgi:dihydroorotase